MKGIQLTRGLVAIVDDEDFEALNRHRWYATKDRQTGAWYAARDEWDGRKQRRVKMHRVVSVAAVGEFVRHVNGNTLDNRKCNLLVSTTRRITVGVGRPRRVACKPSPRGGRPRHSRLKGVTKHSSGRWKAQMRRGGTIVHLGTFDSEEQAHAAYVAAKEAS